MTEKTVSELADGLLEIIQFDGQRQSKYWGKNEQCTKDVWNNVQQSNAMIWESQT